MNSSSKTIKDQVTSQEVKDCYSGRCLQKEIEQLFPSFIQGCINYGYWENFSSYISGKERVDSQLNLYKKLFFFVGLDQAPHSKVLEVGCGRGHGVYLLQQNGHDAQGIDLVPEQIQKCINNYPGLKSCYQEKNAYQTGFPSECFDFVISVEAAQHFEFFLLFAKEAYRILNNKGRVGITTFFFPNKSTKKQISSLIPEDITGTHHAISIEEASLFLEEAGFADIQIISIGEKVFPGFCRWANQTMENINHTPRWLDAYNQNLIDYYLVSGKKL